MVRQQRGGDHGVSVVRARVIRVSARDRGRYPSPIELDEPETGEVTELDRPWVTLGVQLSAQT